MLPVMMGDGQMLAKRGGAYRLTQNKVCHLKSDELHVGCLRDGNKELSRN